MGIPAVLRGYPPFQSGEDCGRFVQAGECGLHGGVRILVHVSAQGIFSRLQKAGELPNAGLIYTWTSPIKFYKAYGHRPYGTMPVLQHRQQNTGYHGDKQQDVQGTDNDVTRNGRTAEVP